MNLSEKRSKISRFFAIYFSFIIVAIIVVLIELSFGKEDASNGSIDNDNTSIQSLYDAANVAFENGNLREMQIQLGKLEHEFPEEDVRPFIAERLSSIPIIQASNLISEYKVNEVKCNMSYGDKLLKVSGNVTEIGQDVAKTVFITLGNGSHTFYDVRCEFEYDEEITQVANLKKGDSITVLGTYKETTSMGPRLKQCYILDK